MSDLPPPGGFPAPPPVPPPSSYGGPPPSPGWWQASDGNWYPPEQQPGGYPPSAATPYGYGYGPAQQARGTNGLAIASMVLGILWLWWIGSVLAIVFGHVSISQVKRTGEQGRGMAIAGLVLGYLGVALFVAVVLIAALGTQAETRFDQIGDRLE